MVERQNTRKSKTKKGLLTRLASNPFVAVYILELWAKKGYAKIYISVNKSYRYVRCGILHEEIFTSILASLDKQPSWLKTDLFAAE